MFTFAFISILISCILFGSGFLFVASHNMEEYLKIGGGALLVAWILQLFIVFSILNPSSDVNYQGILKDKDHRIVYRQETYSCGKDGKDTCTRTVREDHYYLYVEIYGDTTKEIEVSSFTYHKASIGSPYTYADSVTNYYLFNKSAFDTSNAIREQYKPFIPKRPTTYDIGQYDRIVNKEDISAVDSISSSLESSLIQYLMKKPYDVKVVVTKQDNGFYYALMDKWDGAAPNELIVIYGINDEGVIVWSALETFAQNDSNQKLVADFTTLHLGDNDKLTTQLVINDLDFIFKDYIAVSNDEQRFQELQNTASKMPLVIVMIVSVLIQSAIIVFLARRF